MGLWQRSPIFPVDEEVKLLRGKLVSLEKQLGADMGDAAGTRFLSPDSMEIDSSPIKGTQLAAPPTSTTTKKGKGKKGAPPPPITLPGHDSQPGKGSSSQKTPIVAIDESGLSPIAARLGANGPVDGRSTLSGAEEPAVLPTDCSAGKKGSGKKGFAPPPVPPPKGGAGAGAPPVPKGAGPRRPMKGGAKGKGQQTNFNGILLRALHWTKIEPGPGDTVWQRCAEFTVEQINKAAQHPSPLLQVPGCPKPPPGEESLPRDLMKETERSFAPISKDASKGREVLDMRERFMQQAQVVTCLDEKESQNMQIAFSKMPSLDEIALAIAREQECPPIDSQKARTLADMAFVTKEQLERIPKLFQTAVENFKKEGRPGKPKLAKPDQFFMKLAKIPLAKEVLSAWGVASWMDDRDKVGAV